MDEVLRLREDSNLAKSRELYNEGGYSLNIFREINDKSFLGDFLNFFKDVKSLSVSAYGEGVVLSHLWLSFIFAFFKFLNSWIRKLIAIRSLLYCRQYILSLGLLSYRDVEEIMKMWGVPVDHATIQRWAYKFTPLLE